MHYHLRVWDLDVVIVKRPFDITHKITAHKVPVGEMADPEQLRRKIDELEARIKERKLLRKKLKDRKEMLENLKGKGKRFLDFLGLRHGILRMAGAFLTSILQCAVNPTGYPHCNNHNQVFDSNGMPIPIENIPGITIEDGYGHTFTVKPITPVSTPYRPPPRWPPFSMSNVACIFGSKEYLEGCADGSARGDADGAVDGEKDQVAQNDRILYYNPDEITDITSAGEIQLSGQKLEVYCNQLINAPQLYDKNIVAIFPECSTIFRRRGIQRGGTTQSPEYNDGYAFGYNSAYIKAYNLSWIQSYAVTIHVLPPPPNPSGYGDGYGEPGYGEPGYGEPKYGEPGYGEPGYGEPKYGEPGYGEPGYGEPGYGDTTPTYAEQMGGRNKILHLHPTYKALLEKIKKKTSCK